MHTMPAWARDATILGADAPLPLDRPFTAAESDALGVGASLRRRLVRQGLLRPVLRSVFVADHVQDSFRLRVAALKLVVPDHAIVVDRTAAWLHEVDALPRSAIHRMPELDVFSTRASRVRRPGIVSGSRSLSTRDVIDLDGLRVTTKLRTACDLGRLLWRFDALAAIDGFLRVGVAHDELMAEVDRFKGFRGVLQLRALAPLGDERAESQPESALRLHWWDADIGTPEPQVWEHDDAGRQIFRIDIGDPDLRYGAEYFGEQFHGQSDQEHDDERLSWLHRERGWQIDVFTKDAVYGSDLAAVDQLRRGHAATRALRGSAATVIDLSR